MPKMDGASTDIVKVEQRGNGARVTLGAGDALGRALFDREQDRQTHQANAGLGRDSAAAGGHAAPVDRKMSIGAKSEVSLADAKTQAEAAVKDSQRHNAFTNGDREKVVTDKIAQLIKAGGTAEALELVKQATANPDQRPGTLEAMKKAFDKSPAKGEFVAAAKQGMVGYLKASERDGTGYMARGYESAGFSISRLSDRANALGMSDAQKAQAAASYVSDFERRVSADAGTEARRNQIIEKFKVKPDQIAQARVELGSGGATQPAPMTPVAPAQPLAEKVQTREQVENRIGDIVKDRTLSTEEKFKKLDAIAKDELKIGVDGQKMRDILGRQYARVGNEMTQGLELDREANRKFLAEQKAFHDKYQNGILGFEENEHLVAKAEKIEKGFKEQEAKLAREEKEARAAQLAAEREAAKAQAEAEKAAKLAAEKAAAELAAQQKAEREKVLVASVGDIIGHRDMSSAEKVEALSKIGKELGMDPSDGLGFDSRFRRLIGEQLKAKEGDIVSSAQANRQYSDKMVADLDAIRSKFRAVGGFDEIAGTVEKVNGVDAEYKKQDALALRQANLSKFQTALATDRDDVPFSTQMKAADRMATKLGLSNDERKQAAIAAVQELTSSLQAGKAMTPEEFLNLQRAQELAKHYKIEEAKEVRVALASLRTARKGATEFAGAGASDE